MKTHKEMKKAYLETALPMGVFIVRNTRTNRFMIGTSRNLEGSLNRYRFMLKTAGPQEVRFMNPRMVDDYRASGEAAFEFAVLDTLKPKEDPAWDPTRDLNELEAIWMAELKKKGWIPYDKPAGGVA